MNSTTTDCLKKTIITSYDICISEFAHKFLHNVYEYVYEKPYDDYIKRKCDFYIESLDFYKPVIQ